jgi:hypothetical protein
VLLGAGGTFSVPSSLLSSMLCSLCFFATLTGFALTFAAVDAAFSSCVVGLDLDMMVLWFYSNIPLCKRRALAFVSSTPCEAICGRSPCPCCRRSKAGALAKNSIQSCS